MGPRTTPVPPVPEKSEYESPVYEPETESELSEEIWEEFSGGKWCFGCTNCNCN
jgi:hypothetical protein